MKTGTSDFSDRPVISQGKTNFDTWSHKKLGWLLLNQPCYGVLVPNYVGIK